MTYTQLFYTYPANITFSIIPLPLHPTLATTAMGVDCLPLRQQSQKSSPLRMKMAARLRRKEARNLANCGADSQDLA